ncbi:O-Antigen ligase family protein [Collimonas fungivorans]|uniref:O-Antigen ligase family protein n=1 Tax=Collimonas fungivorans TaxID=158899 RepID=A0A127PII4_9BURK|nr:O-antigen ligase family protein [Collimonas fungivorans]AMO97241.1 O-Antigen ligase family protein [Collimonas fungivorans]
MKQINTATWILALLGLLCLLPFIQPFHEAPISSLFAEWQAFLILWTALLIASFHGRKITPLVIPKIALSSVFLLVFLMFQFVIRPPEYLQQVLLPICYVISLYGAFQLGYWLRQHDLVERCIVWLAAFFVFGAVYTVIVQFIQLLWQDFSRMPFMIPRLAGYNPYGNIGQTNHVATYLAIGWAAAHYLFSGGRFPLRLYLPLIFLLFAGIVLTGQRSGFIYVVCLSILFWRFPMKRNASADSSHRSVWFCAVPFAYLALSYLMHAALHYMGSEFTSASQRLNSGWDERLKLLQIGWSLFLEHPWMGIGWGRLVSYEFLKADVLPTLPANHVHNLILQLLAETGVFCTVVVLSIVVLWSLRFLKFVASPEKQFVLGVAIVLGMHSMAEYPLWYAYFLLPLGVLAGMFETGVVCFKLPSRLTGVIARGASFMAVGVLFYSFFEILYVTDMYGRRANIAYSRTLHLAELKEIAQMPSKLFLEPYVDYIDSSGRALNTENLSENRALNQRLLNASINNIVIARQSIYLAMAGDQAEARITFLRMKKIFPNRVLEMLGMVKHAAAHADNENLTEFSKWATEAASQK